MKRTKTLALLMIITLFAVASFAVFKTQFAIAEQVYSWSEIVLDGEYVQGDEFTIPTRTFTYGKDNYESVAILIFPDGTATSEKKVNLSMAGKYTLSYTATVNGRAYKTSEQLLVKYSTVNYSSEATLAEYGAHALAPDYPGLVVRLAEGDTLLFNSVVDISDISVADVLFEAYVTADIPGSLDFGRLYVQFTDVTNPESYLRVRYIHTQSSAGGPMTYVLAGASGQPLSGYESANSTLHVEDIWGAMTRHSFLSTYGTNDSEKELGRTRIGVRLNPQTRELYTTSTFIIDLDNPKHFEKLWNGFDSNKVRVSVWAEDYAATSANFVITKVYGIDLVSRAIEENQAPEITVDCEYGQDNMPVAEVGCEYAVPAASALDLYSGEHGVETQVYYNYSSSNASIVSINNGKFVASKVGRYAIVYTATDVMGNVAEKIYWVRCEKTVATPTVRLASAFPESINAGTVMQIPEVVIENGSGNSLVQIFVNDGSGEKLLESDSYFFNTVGKVTFRIVATDYLGRKGEKTVEVESLKGEKPVFIDAPSFPLYLIAGATYKLPALNAIDYESGAPVEKLAEIEISDANGVKIYNAGDSYVPKVNANLETVTLTYRVGSAECVVQIPTVLGKDENGIHTVNYFHLEGANIVATDDGSQITMTQPNASWRFAHALIAEDLDVRLKVLPESGDIEGFKVVLTDSIDTNVSITAYVYRAEKGVRVVIGDNEFTDTEIGFASNSKSNVIRIGYSNGAITVNGSGVEVDKTVHGERFNGFASSKVYVDLQAINAQSGASYLITEINGQKINATTSDRVAPKIVILGARGGSYDIGSTVNLPAALSGDTLDPNVNFTVRVITPSLKVVTSEDGVVLDSADPTREYQIKVTEYGQYKVTYRATDSFSGRTTTTVYTINVMDKTGPTITFETPFKLTARVGETLVIPNYTLSDNHDAADVLTSMRYCVAPSGDLMALNGNSIVATVAGVYQLRILAMDSFGNITLCRVNVTVTE